MSENQKNQTKSKASAGGRGGFRAAAGRKKGSATKKTREIADRASAEGITPLEYMLDVMRSEPPPGLEGNAILQAMALRFEAAKAAAPYIHPRLSSVNTTLTGDLKASLQIVSEFPDAG